MEYIRVVDSEKYQHYSNRNPVWIKLYLGLLDDFRFTELADQYKWFYLGLAMLASRSCNEVANCDKFVAKKLHLKRTLKLEVLIKAGLIEKCDSNTLASCYQDAILDKKRRDKIREDKKPPKVPLGGSVGMDPKKSTTTVARRRPDTGESGQQLVKAKSVKAEIVEYFNDKAGTNYRPGGGLITEKINARLNEGFTLDDFKTVIDKKYDQWVGTRDAKFLRPETLFGQKFEGYLNQLADLGRSSEKTKAELNAEAGKQWVADRDREDREAAEMQNVLEIEGEVLDD